MATSSAWRLELPPDPPVRSAERERLREAVERYRAVAARFDRLQAAVGRAQSDAFEHFLAIEALKGEIEAAKRVSQQGYVAELLGDPVPGGGQTLESVEARIERARAEHRRCKRAAEVIEQELAGITGMRNRFAAAKAELDSAVNAVIASEVGEKLAARAMSLKMEFGAVRELGLLLHLTNWELYNIEIPGIIPPEASLLAPWRPTIERLRAGDVDVPLPDVLQPD